MQRRESAPFRASCKAGLSCSRNPLRNQCTELTTIFAAIASLLKMCGDGSKPRPEPNDKLQSCRAKSSSERAERPGPDVSDWALTQRHSSGTISSTRRNTMGPRGPREASVESAGLIRVPNLRCASLERHICAS